MSKSVTRESMLTRRHVLGLGAGVAAALGARRLLGTYAPSPRVDRAALASAPLPAPETTTIRIAPRPCDAPIMAAERYLQQEGFTRIEIVGPTTFASGRIDMTTIFFTDFAAAVQDGQRIVGLGGLHPGCVEIWAQPGIGSMKDLRGKTIVVRSKALTDDYAYLVVVLKQAGVNPSDVNFVVQPDANPVSLYIEGKNDAVLVATTGAAALGANPANKGHIIHHQVKDDPWAKLDCCLLVTTQDWYRANPVATKRALRAIFRAADFQPDDRADAVKFVTDKGLFGGPNNFNYVLMAANMVPANWRDLDAEKSMRFYGPLLADAGLRIGIDEVVKALDLRTLRELRTELRRF